jgi:hypothetical protein
MIGERIREKRVYYDFSIASTPLVQEITKSFLAANVPLALQTHRGVTW